MRRAAAQPHPALGTDAWSRAATRVIALAGAQGRRIDWAEITLYDVRELQALAWRWQARGAAASRWRRPHLSAVASPVGFPRGTPEARPASQK